MCFANNVMNTKVYAGESYNVLVLDSSNKLKNSFLPITNVKYLKIGKQNSFEKFGNGVNVTRSFDNSIYHVTASNFIVKYKINFTNYKLPEALLKEYDKVDVSNKSSRTKAMIELLNKLNRGSYVLSIFNIYENINYFFFQYGITDKGTFTVLYNKLIGKTYIGIPENNIDSGLFGTPLTMKNDTLVTWVFPYELKARIKYIDSIGTAPNLHYNRLKQLSESVSDNDNPIIARFSLK